MTSGWSAQVRALDSQRILTVLDQHDVRYVLVGGVAAMLHGFSGATFDLDAVPATTTANLNRLGSALMELDALPWADPGRRDLFADGKPPEADDFGYTAEGLRKARVWHLTSSAGLIDIAMDIDGVGDYSVLAKSAVTQRVFGIGVRCASLEDIITSKRAAARPKDLRALAELEQLRDNMNR